ncbi:hypothetical protein HJG60_010988 [Phyllostomus discolor]|uniref:Uncharacterized protein n=1 Tax=Phyllostomus discolor TaxID=89673 RepID=A0A834ACH3_9CHIR|nr:hypothetical protein HJG60_010988 [Phyllostomus discolor]
MQTQMAPTPKPTTLAARSPGLEGAPKTGNSRQVSVAEPWPVLMGQAGSPCVLSGFCSLRLGNIRASTHPSLLELLPAAPCYSRQRTWALLKHREGVAENHILPSSLPVHLIYFEFHCAWIVNEFQTSIVRNLMSSGIKL